MKTIVLGSLILLATVLYAQNNPTMSAKVGFSPGDSFTLFITLEEPMPQIDSLYCIFQLAESAKPSQQDFAAGFNCDSQAQKDDDKHYHVKVRIPKEGIASGDYKLGQLAFIVNGVRHQYSGDSLPALAAVTVKNPQNVDFSKIKELKIQ